MNSSNQNAYEHYIETRKIYDDLETSQQDSLDKQMLTLSGASLAFSIAFVEKAIPLEQAQLVVLLIASWAAFSAAILFTIASFKSSVTACRDFRDQVDRNYSENSCAPVTLHSDATKKIEICNTFAFWAFVFGLVFLVSFATINAFHLIDGDLNMTKANTTDVSKGGSPSQPPSSVIVVPCGKVPPQPARSQSSNDSRESSGTSKK